MPAKNEHQKRAFCMSLAIKEGKLDGSKFPEMAKMAASMSIKQLQEY